MKNVLALLFLVSTTVFSQEIIPLQPCQELVKYQFLRHPETTTFVEYIQGYKCMPKLDMRSIDDLDGSETPQELQRHQMVSQMRGQCQQQQSPYNRYNPNKLSIDHVRKIHFGDIVKFNGKLYKCEDWSK